MDINFRRHNCLLSSYQRVQKLWEEVKDDTAKYDRRITEEHSQKVCEFFYSEKCANFRKMSISEGYFIKLKLNCGQSNG